MDFARIQYLAKALPVRKRPGLSPAESQVEHFVAAYRDLAFGYHFVKTLLRENLRMPPDVHERWIGDLYWFERRGDYSDAVVQALGLNHPANRGIENAVQAFLLTDATLERIAMETGLTVDCLRAYEQLFFNIRDRKKEALLISQVVYPETRLVEMMEGYLAQVDRGAFLKRSAHNNSFEDVAYFVGMKVESVANASLGNAKEMANRLEATIMANGYFLARNGLASQRGAHGINAARGLILAAKQSGLDTGDDDDLGASSIGEALMTELAKTKGGEMRARIQRTLEAQGSRPKEVDHLSDEEKEVLADET